MLSVIAELVKRLGKWSGHCFSFTHSHTSTPMAELICSLSWHTGGNLGFSILVSRTLRHMTGGLGNRTRDPTIGIGDCYNSWATATPALAAWSFPVSLNLHAMSIIISLMLIFPSPLSSSLHASTHIHASCLSQGKGSRGCGGGESA